MGAEHPELRSVDEVAQEAPQNDDIGIAAELTGPRGRRPGLWPVSTPYQLCGHAEGLPGSNGESDASQGCWTHCKSGKWRLLVNIAHHLARM